MFSPLIYFKYLISRSAVKFIPRCTYIGLILLIATFNESDRRSAENTLPHVPSPSNSPFKYFEEMLIAPMQVDCCQKNAAKLASNRLCCTLFRESTII